MDMDYARRIPRLVAAILDIIVMLIIFAILGVAGVVEAADPEEEFNVVSSIVSAVIVLIYYVGLTAILGQTLGKMAMGIRVVNIDGEKPAPVTVLTREVIVRVLGTVLAVVLGPIIAPGTGALIGGIVALVAIIWILFDDRRQGLHDKVAKTFVVKA
ncbi:MAG: RDD family protein [Chloroflexota bacterium]|nr:RDD family protein [Chloroflexota bacterium]